MNVTARTWRLGVRAKQRKVRRRIVVERGIHPIRLGVTIDTRR